MVGGYAPRSNRPGALGRRVPGDLRLGGNRPGIGGNYPGFGNRPGIDNRPGIGGSYPGGGYRPGWANRPGIGGNYPGGGYRPGVPGFSVQGPQ
jgi:hypothetical protein